MLLYGNLSKSNITFPEKEEGVKEDIDGDTIELKNYKQEIGKLKKKNDYLEKQYIECERALRKKTEEAERLKSEIKDIKLKISLENEIRSNVEETDSIDIGDLYKMKSSGFRRNDPTTESSPIKNYPNMESAAEEEFNCMDCDYQGSSQDLLQKHFQFTHTMDKYKCLECNQQC